MSSFPDCKNIVAEFSSFTVPYSDWIRDGPGEKYLYSPTWLYCLDNGTEVPIGRTPLEYRNNELSFFLISMGIFEYPWNKQGYRDRTLPSSIELIEETEIADNAHNLQTVIKDQDDNTVIKFFGRMLHPNIKVKVPHQLTTKLSYIFGFGCVLISNDTNISNNLNKRFILYDDPNRFVLTLSASPLPYPSLERYLDQYIPDNEFSNEIAYHSNLNIPYEYRIFSALSKKYDIALSIAAIAIPYNSTITTLRVFSMTHRDNIDKLLLQLAEVFHHDSIEPETAT